MSRISTSFKDIGPLLIIVVIMTFAYISIRERLNWNRDRINDMIGKTAQLQSQITQLEQGLVGVQDVSPPPRPSPSPWTPKMGDISYYTAGFEGPELAKPLQQWIQMLTPAYTSLKSRHTPPRGRAIVGRIIFDVKGKVDVFDYVKAPVNTALATDLEKAIRNTKLPKIADKLRRKLPYSSVQIKFDP